MIGNRLQDPSVALLRPREVVLVFEDDAEVDEAAERGRIPLQRLLVAGLSLFVVAEAVVDHAEGEQGARMARIAAHSLFVGRGHLLDRGPRIGQEAALGSPEFGGAGRLAGNRVEFLVGFAVLAARPERFGSRSHARCRVVASLAGGRERLARLVVGGDRCVGETLMEECQCAAVSRPQGFQRILGSAEQPLADTEPHRGGRAAIGARLQIPHGRLEFAVGGGLGAQGLHECLDFCRAEWAVAEDQVANVGSGGGNHERAPSVRFFVFGSVVSWSVHITRASGGSRTRNPRITNAVLCQLKLRWRDGRLGCPGGHRPQPRKTSARPAPSSREALFSALGRGVACRPRAGRRPQQQASGLRPGRSILPEQCGSGA